MAATSLAGSTKFEVGHETSGLLYWFVDSHHNIHACIGHSVACFGQPGSSSGFIGLSVHIVEPSGCSLQYPLPWLACC